MQNLRAESESGKKLVMSVTLPFAWIAWRAPFCQYVVWRPPLFDLSLSHALSVPAVLKSSQVIAVNVKVFPSLRPLISDMSFNSPTTDPLGCIFGRWVPECLSLIHI